MASVLNQDMPDLELLVVCDGAPAATASFARRLAEQDSRVRVFDNAKGERHGEAHRAHALAHANGRYIAHINDDGLWFPDHLSSLVAFLENVDFGNVTHTHVDEADRPHLLLGDLASATERTRMLETPYNIANLSDVAYSMEAYRRLPEGWAPGPSDIWTDLHMWRKFLRCEGLRFATLAKTTTLFFRRPLGDVSDEARAQVLRWDAMLRNPLAREQLRQQLWSDVVREVLSFRAANLGTALELEKAENRRLRSLLTPQIPEDFDPHTYLSLHPDLIEVGVDGREHYLQYGFYEGRRYR